MAVLVSATPSAERFAREEERPYFFANGCPNAPPPWTRTTRSCEEARARPSEVTTSSLNERSTALSVIIEPPSLTTVTRLAGAASLRSAPLPVTGSSLSARPDPDAPARYLGHEGIEPRPREAPDDRALLAPRRDGEDAAAAPRTRELRPVTAEREAEVHERVEHGV